MSVRRVLKGPFSSRLLKSVQVQGGKRCAEWRTPDTPQRAREGANAADGPFSAACRRMLP
ncbi:MAG: hypothetical protein MZV64_70585 [Ignavibacteriales bacterium]|nr:hypothetical protein [Ignavibacteriales bacterium]